MLERQAAVRTKEPPVRKAGAVRQYEACRQFFVTRIIDDIRVNPIVGQRFIEFEIATGRKPQKRFCDDDLCDRCDLELSLVIYRSPRSGLAEVDFVDQVPVAQDTNGRRTDRMPLENVSYVGGHLRIG